MITFRLAGRLIWKSTLIWAAGLAVLVVSGVKAYTSRYATEASRQLLVSTLGATKALSALYGPPVRLDTTGGFLVWRYGTIIAVVSGVWALLTVTRLLRGEEDESRTDLLLAGPLDPIHLLLSHVAAFGVGARILGAALALGSMAGGLPVEGSLRFGAVGLVDALIFGSIAAVASQLADHRRAAAGWTGAILAGSYLVRAVADGSVGHEWMVWLSPLGWSEQLSPFGDPDLVAVVLLIATPAALLAMTIGLRRHRDVGAGVWTRMSTPPALVAAAAHHAGPRLAPRSGLPSGLGRRHGRVRGRRGLPRLGHRRLCPPGREPAQPHEQVQRGCRPHQRRWFHRLHV